MYPRVDYSEVKVINRSDWLANPFGGEEICLTEDPAKHIIITQTATTNVFTMVI